MPLGSTLPHIPPEEMTILGTGSHLQLVRVQTPAGPREIVHRLSGLYQAAKMLLLWIYEDTELIEPAAQNFDPLDRITRTVLETGPANFQVFLLASHRPLTHFETMPFRTTYQIELPGGVLEYGEGSLAGAIREAAEETGITSAANIVQAAPIIDPPCPFDAGSHVEIYCIQACIMRGVPDPPDREGIIPNKCRSIPLPYALDYLQRLRRKQYCVEGHAMTALWAFNMKLYELMLQDQTQQPQVLLSGVP